MLASRFCAWSSLEDAQVWLGRIIWRCLGHFFLIARLTIDPVCCITVPPLCPSCLCESNITAFPCAPVAVVRYHNNIRRVDPWATRNKTNSVDDVYVSCAIQRAYVTHRMRFGVFFNRSIRLVSTRPGGDRTSTSSLVARSMRLRRSLVRRASLRPTENQRFAESSSPSPAAHQPH